MSIRPVRGRTAPLLVIVTAIFAAVSATDSEARSARRSHPLNPVLSTVSTDAARVTAGDVLVEVVVRNPVARANLRIEVGGVDVTDTFQRVGPETLRGLVTGLPEGETTLVATTCLRRLWGHCLGSARHRIAKLTLTNHPVAGPVFSGAHQEPFYCETEPAGLGPAQDADCFAPTQVVYRYRTTDGDFAELANPSDRPDDLATVEIDGTEQPFIVRLERGVINRGIYEIAALYDGAEPSPFRDEAGWNGKLVMTFGGGCNVGYHQGSATAGVLNTTALSRGYAVASNSLLVNETNCNPVLASETAMMTKERVIEVYGPLTHTIGSGGSGGAIMQYTIAHAYPGILDGLLPSASFADSFSNAGPPDCLLLTNYLETPTGAALSAAQRQAIGGHQVFGTCRLWVATFANRVNATTGCPSIIPPETIYDPVTNPTGVRCSLQDHVIKQLGVDPETGFARGIYDNVGVQYGVAALEEGILDVDEFLDLNEGMGGLDRDGFPQAERSMADPDAIEAAFATGLITSGSGGLATTPAIDLRGYTDQFGNDLFGDIHTSFWSVAMHERLVRDGVDPAVHSRWITQSGDSHFAEALDAMDAWLTAIAADQWYGSAAEKVVRDRPPEAAPGCWPTPGGDKVEDLEACYAGPFPFTGDPRTVAGAPITTDVTCHTKTPTPEDYAVTFSDEQWERLLSIFPDGVCDYDDLPGVGQVPLAGTWQSYE